MGRRSTFTQELADEICNRIAEGEPLRQICRDEHMPNFVTVYDWRDSNPEFAQRLARAREIGEEVIEQGTLEIADDGRNDWMEKFNDKGESIGWTLNGEHVQRSKLRIETRLKLLKVWNPAKYAEKLALGGASGLPPIQTNSTIDPSEAYKRMLEAGK
jgi:hypothetical protein